MADCQRRASTQQHLLSHSNASLRLQTGVSGASGPFVPVFAGVGPFSNPNKAARASRVQSTNTCSKKCSRWSVVLVVQCCCVERVLVVVPGLSSFARLCRGAALPHPRPGLSLARLSRGAAYFAAPKAGAFSSQYLRSRQFPVHSLCLDTQA